MPERDVCITRAQEREDEGQNISGVVVTRICIGN